MSELQKYSVLKTPDGLRILLLKQIGSSWLAVKLPAAANPVLALRSEKCLVASRYLRRCDFIEQLPQTTNLLPA